MAAANNEYGFVLGGANWIPGILQSVGLLMASTSVD